MGMSAGSGASLGLKRTSVKVEAQEGALSLSLSLQDLEGNSQVLRVTHEGGVIEVPSVEGEARASSLIFSIRGWRDKVNSSRSRGSPCCTPQVVSLP